jgi:hypothetical protein
MTSARARGTLALLALVLLAAPALASPSAPQAPRPLSFHVPAQVGGDLSVGSSQWALLLIHAGFAGIGLELPDGAAATTRTVVGVTAPGLVGDGFPTRPADGGGRVLPGEATVAFTSGRWASLFVVADRIEATLSGEGRLDSARPSDALEAFLPPAPRGTLPPFPHHPAVDAAALVHGGDGAQLHLAATGLRRLEWYNATVRCSMACPDGPPYQSWTLPGGDRVEMRNYTALDASAGRATVDGQADALVLGGPALDVAVDGWARLPEAALQGCAECGGGRTLRLDGDRIAFLGLGPEGKPMGTATGPGAAPAGGGERLRGSLDAPQAFAALDEGPRLPLAAAAGAAAAGGGLALAAVLGLRALGLLRVRREEEAGFGHQRRAGLYGLVAGEPGLTFREVERRLGWGNGVTRHHLDILVSQGHIVARRHLNTVRYFENHGRFDADWQEVVHRRDPGARWLLDAIREAPRSQRDLVELAAERGWSRSATQRKLARLVADGLVETRPGGSGRLYALAPAAPAAPAVRPVGAGVTGTVGRWLGRTGPAPGGAADAAPARPPGTAGP